MSALTLQNTPLRQVKDVKNLLMNEQARNQLAAVAAKHMNPERMMRVVANAIRTTPQLQECEPMSFLGALMHCAAMGLEPNTPLGHAYLIPFKNNRKGITEVQTIIGYKGFIDLARRSGQLASIHGDVVYSDDEIWSHEYGSNQHLRHRPGPHKGTRIGAYCHIKLNLGDGITAEGHRFMTIEEIIAHRDKHSQGWKTAVRFGKTAESPWNEKNPQFEAMAIKTVVRALANRGEMPMSIEFMEALQTDEAKVDYRAFAMDPTAGVQIEAQGGDDTIDGEAAEADAAKQVEAKPAEPAKRSRAEAQKGFRQQEAEKKPPVARREDAQQASAAPAEAEVAADNVHTESPETVSQDASQGGPHEGDRAGEGPETAPAHQAAEEVDEAEEEPGIDLMSFPTCKTIIDDAMDLGASASREAHAKVIEILKSQQPEVHAALEAELDHIGG